MRPRLCLRQIGLPARHLRAADGISYNACRPDARPKLLILHARIALAHSGLRRKWRNW